MPRKNSLQYSMWNFNKKVKLIFCNCLGITCPEIPLYENSIKLGQYDLMSPCSADIIMTLSKVPLCCIREKKLKTFRYVESVMITMIMTMMMC